MKHHLSLSLAAVLAAGLSAQPRLVLDLNKTVLGTASSFPSEFTPSGSTMWLAATTFAHGREVFTIDTNGTVTLGADLRPNRASSSPFALRAYGAQGVTFVANDSSGRGIFRLDGAGQTPVRLTPRPAPEIDATWAVNAGPNVFFLANDRTHGFELWASQGAAGDARMLRDIMPGAVGSSINSLTAIGSKVIFLADDGQHGKEWWVSDGTTQGTVMIKDMNPGPAQGAFLSQPAVINGRAYIQANDGVTGIEPYSTNGDVGNLELVKDIVPGVQNSLPQEFADIGGGKFVFAALNGRTFLRSLFVSDGTPEDTNEIPLPNSFGGVDPRAIAGFNGGAYFTGISNAGNEFGFTDGTIAGTGFLDLNPNGNSTISQIVTVGSTAYFDQCNCNSTRGNSLWVSDGTLAGSQMLSPQWPQQIVPFGNGVLFVRSTTANGSEPWKTDGTVAGTVLAADVDPFQITDGSRATIVGEINGRAIFVGTDGTAFGVYATDGTATGTVQLASPFEFAYPLIRLADRLVMASRDQLLMTDGTPAGTQTMQLAVRSPRRPDAGAALLPGNRAVFGISAQTDNLYVTDGTPAGTRSIGTFFGNDFITGRESGRVYFSAGVDIFATDGTTEGTSSIFVAGPPQGLRDVNLIGEINGKVIYSDGGFAVFATDGTVNGTLQIATSSLITEELSPARYIGGKLVFSVFAGVWATDGSQAGTQELLASSRSGCFLSKVGDAGLIWGRQLSQNPKYWRTDGTVAGTTEFIPSFRVPSANSSSRLQPITGERTLLGSTGGPSTIVITDGTDAGTEILAQGAGPATDLADGRVFYTALTQYFGTELYVLDLDATAQSVGVGCSASWPPPELSSNEPVLGTTLTLDVRRAQGATLIALGAPAPIAQALAGNDCALHIDPAFAPVTVAADAQGTATIAIPNDPSLVGSRVMTQAVTGPTSAPLGFDLTNGLRLVLTP